MKYTYVVPTGYSDLFKFTNQALNAEIALQVRVQNGWTREDGVSFREEGNLRIVPHSPQSLDWLDSLSNRLENFFTLFLGTSIGIKQVRLVQASKAGSLVYRRRSRKEKISMEMWVRCPFNLVGDALDKWLAVPEDKQSVELTLLGVVRNSTLYTETEFLSLAQALEGFGRITIAQGRSGRTKFASLTKQVCSLLSVGFAKRLLNNKELFVRKVVDTRDYFTHLGLREGNAVVKDSGDLFLLNQRLKALLRCAILLDLGIPEQYLTQPILFQAKRYQLW